MSIKTQIDRIEQNVANTYSALQEKGATMPTEQNSDNLAATARSVPTGGGGGVSVQADWNQYDETAADFIKNKPFGETPTVLYEGTDLAPMADGEAYLIELPPLEFAEGVQYTVVIDGEEYATEGTNIVGIIFIGSPVLFGGADNGLPFICMLNTDTGEGTMFVSFISLTSLRIVESSIKKIEQKYLPESSIVLQRNLFDADNARYLYKTQSGDESDRVTLNELRAFAQTGRPIYLNVNGMWHQPTLIGAYEPLLYGYVQVMMKDGEQEEYYTAEYTA